MTPARPHADLLHAVAAPGCPACRTGEHTLDRYEFGFVYEHHGDRHTLQNLRDSLGFCPAHTRRLLARREAPWVMRVAYADVVAAARDELASRPPHRARRPCPMCESAARTEGTLLRALAAALDDGGVAEGYAASGGCCLPHLRRALGSADLDEGLWLLQVFEQRLGNAADPDHLIECLAGRDADIAARADARARLRTVGANLTPNDRPEVLAALHGRLRVDACPACLEGGLAETRHLEWMAAECAARPSRLAWDGPWLCPQHLHDLASLDPDAGRLMARWAQSRLEMELARLRDRLSLVPRRGVRARARAAASQFWRRGQPADPFGDRALLAAEELFHRHPTLAEALKPFVGDRPCSTCRAGWIAETRFAVLLAAALDDRPTARVYEESHGLCLRHSLGTDRAPGPALIRDQLRTRLAILAWELEEAGRKSSWSGRYEARWNEATAWLRAPAFLDGRVFLGGPPPLAGQAD